MLSWSKSYPVFNDPQTLLFIDLFQISNYMTVTYAWELIRFHFPLFFSFTSPFALKLQYCAADGKCFEVDFGFLVSFCASRIEN